MINIVEEIEAVVTKMQAQAVKPWSQNFLTTPAGKFIKTEDRKAITAEGQTDTETPYYDYGTWKTLTNKLLKKDQDKEFMYKKYPLIALNVVAPFECVNNVYTFTLNIAILAFTDKNYTEQERQLNVFKPILYPLYEAFFNQLKGQGFSYGKGNLKRPEHKGYDRYFWGSDSDKGNRFNDPLDAIEIIDLKISKTQNCIIS
jgi:hypothetical protein